MAVVAMKQLLEAGVHFGHQTRRWDPRMAEYIFQARNGIHIIDLQKASKKIDEAYEFIKEQVEEGKTVLFVGTKKQAQDCMKDAAIKSGMYYVNQRWLGGMLTNFDTIQKRIQRLKDLENNIKENAYINTVKVSKKIPDRIHIEVEEREASYMLEYGNGFVYVNNQGYMLEISSIKKELPILIGISTSKEDYKAGNRLNEEDLIKLGTVIKIMNSAQTNGIASLITKIDISNENNYTLFLETERKTAYLGDCSNLETRMLFLVGILEKEKENPGEIFINMNLNTDDAYFRESV